MARMLPRSKKTIVIFLLIGSSSFYVYQQFGGQNSTKKERSPGIQQDTSGQEESLGMSSGENGRRYVGDKHGMKWRPVLRKGTHFEMDSSNLDVRKKAVPVKLDSINNQAKKLKAKYTGGKNVAEKRTHRNGNDEFRKTKPNRVNRRRKQSNRHSNEKKRSPVRRGREGRKYQKNQPNGGTDGKNPPGRERGDVTNYSGETHDKSRIHIQYGEVNTRKVKPVKPINDLQQDSKIENKQQNKKLCNITFEYGQMCPTLYTDLGGYCKIDKKVPGGFDCPDIRRKGYNELRSTQLVLTRLLKIFDLVARKHDIKYWIISGTLLGAARHRGFIPWDEDADIEMTLDEYIKLFKCCKNEFPEGIFFQSSETDPYLKSQNETENRLLRHTVVGLYRRLWNPRLRDTKSCTKFCLAYGCGWDDGLMIDIFIAEDTMHPYHLRRVFPLKEMLFEGFRFPVPGNWRKILQYKYGDYNKELGEYDERIPEDNSDPFHSCEELKQANNG